MRQEGKGRGGSGTVVRSGHKDRWRQLILTDRYVPVVVILVVQLRHLEDGQGHLFERLAETAEVVGAVTGPERHVDFVHGFS